MFFVEKSAIPEIEKQGFKVTSKGIRNEAGEEAFIAYSQKVTRAGVSQMPIVGTSVNTVEPCYGKENALVVNKAQKEIFEKINMFTIDPPVEECDKHSWRVKDYDDSRFDVIGTTSLYSMLKANNVNDLADD